MTTRHSPLSTATWVPPHTACITLPTPFRGSSRGELICKTWGNDTQIHITKLKRKLPARETQSWDEFVDNLALQNELQRKIDNTVYFSTRKHFFPMNFPVSGTLLVLRYDMLEMRVCLARTCVVSVTEASCRYSELPQPNTWPSVETARLQSPYVLTCWIVTPSRSPPTRTGSAVLLWCPRPEQLHNNWVSPDSDH